jgi:hypothetical protein
MVRTPEGKRPLGKHKRRWEDNIKIDFQEMGYEGMEWIDLAQNRCRWRALVHETSDSKNAGNFLTS